MTTCRFWPPLLLGLLISAAALAADSESSKERDSADVYAAPCAVVGYPSYSDPADRTTVLQHLAFREAVIFHLKRNGFQVASECSLPRRTHGYNYCPTSRLTALANQRAAIIGIQVDKDVHVVLLQTAASNPRIIDLPFHMSQILSEAERVSRECCDLTGVPFVSLPPRSGELDRDFFGDSSRMDADYSNRLRAMQLLLRSLSLACRSESIDVNVPAQLAVYNALHGAYFTRRNEIRCLDSFARARFFAELASYGRREPELEKLQSEVDAMGRRFLNGEPVRVIDSPLLAEMAATLRVEGLKFSTVENYPAVENLFDFVLRVETPVEWRGYRQALKAFANSSSHVVDAGLVWAKSCITMSSFDATMYMTTEVFAREWAKNIVTTMRIAGVSPEDLRLILDRYERAARENRWSLLDNLGHARRRADQKPRDAASLEVLSLFNVFDQHLRSVVSTQPATRGEPTYSACMEMSLEDVLGELIDNGIEWVFMRKWRWENIADQVGADEVAGLLTRFGSDRYLAFKDVDVKPAVTVGSILDYAAILEELQRRTGSGAPAVNRIRDRLPPPVQDIVRNYRAGSDVSADQQTVVAEGFDQLLEDRQLYRCDLFQQVCLRISQLTELREASHVDNVQIRKANYALLRAVFPDVFVDWRYDSPSPPPWQRGLNRSFRRAKSVLFSGGFAEAADLLEPLLQVLDNGSEKLDVLTRAMFRAGRVDATLTRLATVNSTGLERDELCAEILKWHCEDFGMIAPSLFTPLQPNTRSARDYFVRADAAFRSGDYDTVLQVFKEYHYTDDSCCRTLASFARILKGDRKKQDWQEMRNCILALYSNNSAYLYHWHHWVKVLDENLGDEPAWKQIKTDLQLDARAIISRAQVLINANPTAEQLLSMYQQAKSVSDGYTSGVMSRSFAEIAFRVKHTLLGRYILAATDNLAHPEKCPEVLQMIVDTIRRTQRALVYEPGKQRDTHASDVRVFATMVSCGADTQRVAECVAAIPDVRHLFGGRVGAAFTSPAAARVMLDRLQLANAKWEVDMSWDWAEVLDYEAMFVAAYLNGDDDAAVALATGTSADSRPVDWVAYYFPDPQAAVQWITVNAPDRLTADRWQRAVSKANPQREELVRQRLARKPLKLDDSLVSYFNKPGASN